MLEEGYSEDGFSPGVRHVNAERRPLHFHGYTQGIPTLSSPSGPAGLCYSKKPGLPRGFGSTPVETVERMADGEMTGRECRGGRS